MPQSGVLGLSDTSEEPFLQHCCLWIRWRQANAVLSIRHTVTALKEKKKLLSCFNLCVSSHRWTVILLSRGDWKSPFHLVQSSCPQLPLESPGRSRLACSSPLNLTTSTSSVPTSHVCQKSQGKWQQQRKTTSESCSLQSSIRSSSLEQLNWKKGTEAKHATEPDH